MMGIFTCSVSVRALDFDWFAVQISLPMDAIANEDNLFSGARVDGALVVAENNMQAGHFRIRLVIIDSDDFDGFLNGSGTASPTVVCVSVAWRGAALGGGRRPGIGADLGALEVFFHSRETHLETARPLPSRLECDVAGYVVLRQVNWTKAALACQADVRDVLSAQPARVCRRNHVAGPDA
jgi:hypothetical protein